MLYNWIKKYKEMGYNIVERKRGRSPTMQKILKKKQNETKDETIKRLEQENLLTKEKINALKSAEKMEELYVKAMDAMKGYGAYD